MKFDFRCVKIYIGEIERYAIFLGNFSINKEDDIYCSDLVGDDQNPWIVPNLTFKYMGD